MGRLTVRKRPRPGYLRIMPHPRTVAVLSALLLPTALCAADILTVDDDGPADFDSIQAAIDAASDGDEILVADGTYRSDGDQVVDPRGKRILIRAREGASPVITGDGVRRGIRRGISGCCGGGSLLIRLACSGGRLERARWRVLFTLGRRRGQIEAEGAHRRSERHAC